MCKGLKIGFCDVCCHFPRDQVNRPVPRGKWIVDSIDDTFPLSDVPMTTFKPRRVAHVKSESDRGVLQKVQKVSPLDMYVLGEHEVVEAIKRARKRKGHRNKWSSTTTFSGFLALPNDDFCIDLVSSNDKDTPTRLAPKDGDPLSRLSPKDEDTSTRKRKRLDTKPADRPPKAERNTLGKTTRNEKETKSVPVLKPGDIDTDPLVNFSQPPTLAELEKDNLPTHRVIHFPHNEYQVVPTPTSVVKPMFLTDDQLCRVESRLVCGKHLEPCCFCGKPEMVKSSNARATFRECATCHRVYCRTHLALFRPTYMRTDSFARPSCFFCADKNLHTFDKSVWETLLGHPHVKLQLPIKALNSIFWNAGVRSAPHMDAIPTSSSAIVGHGLGVKNMATLHNDALSEHQAQPEVVLNQVMTILSAERRLARKQHTLVSNLVHPMWDQLNKHDSDYEASEHSESTDSSSDEEGL